MTLFSIFQQIGRDALLRIYAVFLAAATVGLAVGLIGQGVEFAEPWAVVALAILGAAAERGRVRLSSNLELSISLLPTLFAAVVFGPLAAMLVAMASMAGDFRQPYMKWTIYTLSGSITGAATGFAAGLAGTWADSVAGSIAMATVAGAVTAQILDTCFAAATVTLRGTGRPFEVASTLAPVLAASVPLYTPVVAFLAYVYETLSPWTLPLFLAPALAAQHLFGLYQRQRSLTDDLTVANVQLERANLSFAAALVAALDARDRYTAGHSAAVAGYSRDIATRLGLSAETQQLVHLCGLVHDIGKIGLPAGLLEKQGSLTLDERRQMQEHPIIGERILSKVDTYDQIAQIVRHHHERVDGCGYPDALARESIPLLSRIIAVADAYDAMTSDRPYRKAMPSRVARLRLAQAVESQFDTTIVAAFEAILAGASPEYCSGAGIAPRSRASQAAPLKVVRVA